MKRATISALSYYVFIVIVCATIIGSGDAGKKRKITHPNTSGNTDGTAGTSNSMDIPTKVAKKSGTVSPNGEDGKGNAAGKLKMKPTIAATSIVKNNKQKRHKNTKKVTAYNNNYTAKASKVTVAGESKKVHETTQQMMSVVNNKSFAAASKLTVSGNNNSNVEEDDEKKKGSELRRHCQRQCCEQYCADGDDRGGIDGNSPAAAGFTAATLLLRNNNNANMSSSSSRVKRMAGTCRGCDVYFDDALNFCDNCYKPIVDVNDSCANATAHYACSRCTTKNGCDYLTELYQDADDPDRCEWVGSRCKKQDPCTVSGADLSEMTCGECTSGQGCIRLNFFRRDMEPDVAGCLWWDSMCQNDVAASDNSNQGSPEGVLSNYGAFDSDSE